MQELIEGIVVFGVVCGAFCTLDRWQSRRNRERVMRQLQDRNALRAAARRFSQV